MSQIRANTCFRDEAGKCMTYSYEITPSSLLSSDITALPCHSAKKNEANTLHALKIENYLTD